jgi:DNA-binding transcriptional MerR regulator
MTQNRDRARVGSAERLGEPARGARDRFSISELASECGVTLRAIRFYEAKGLLRPERVGKVRVYSRKDRARLLLVLRGKNLGFSLEDIADYLRLYDADPAQIAQTRHLLEKVEAAIAALRTKHADLERTLRELEDIRVKCIVHLKERQE